MTRHADGEDLGEIRQRVQDAKRALLGARLDMIRLLISLAPLIDRLEPADPSGAAMLRETLEAVIVGLELEGIMGGDKVDVALAPDAVVRANVAKWRITLSRATPPLHRYSRVLESEEVELLVQVVRAVAVEGDDACERALLVSLPEDVAIWFASHNDLDYDEILTALSASVQKLALLVVVEASIWTRWRWRLQAMATRRKLPR